MKNMIIKKFNEFSEENKPTDKIKTNKKALYSKKIRIYNADKQFLISPMFYFWSEFPNPKVFNPAGEFCGNYNIYTDNSDSKILIVSNEDVLAYITPEILDFESAQNISEIDQEKYREWKNIIQ